MGEGGGGGFLSQLFSPTKTPWSVMCHCERWEEAEFRHHFQGGWLITAVEETSQEASRRTVYTSVLVTQSFRTKKMKTGMFSGPHIVSSSVPLIKPHCLTGLSGSFLGLPFVFFRACMRSPAGPKNKRRVFRKKKRPAYLDQGRHKK